VSVGGAEGILDQASSQYGLEDIEAQKVEVKKVLTVEELQGLVEKQVEERTKSLKARLAELKADLESGSGDLERAAADAALESEAKALEDKAAADLRAEQAEAKAKTLEGQLEAAREEIEGLKAKIAKHAAELEEAKASASAAQEDAEPITKDDHSRARRLADALIEDVVNEEEEKAKESIEAGSFAEDFADELKGAYQTYCRRTKAAVRAEQDHWQEALAALKG